MVEIIIISRRDESMLISKYIENCMIEKITDFERIYSIVLSNDYKGFLMKYNGGETPKTNFSKGKIKTDIRRFYGFTGENKYSDLRFAIANGLGEELLLKNRLPIATNSYGDYFVINVSDEKNGEISFIYHDNPQAEFEIASNFKEFVSLCKSEPIGHIRSIEERKKSLIDAGKGDKITQIKIDCWQKEIDKYKDMIQEEVIL